MLSGLRLSFRIARREAWRYRRRSALSITLLTLPLLAVSFGASFWDSTDLSTLQKMEQLAGEADAYAEWYTDSPIQQESWDSEYPWVEWTDAESDDREDDTLADQTERLLAVLPEGSSAVPFSLWNWRHARIAEEPRSRSIEVLPYDLSHPLYERGNVLLVKGRAAGPGEVVLSSALARTTGYRIGDELEIKLDGEWSAYDLVGVVERPSELSAQFAVSPDFGDGAPESDWLIDVPGEFTVDHAKALNAIGIGVVAPSIASKSDTTLSPPDADGIAIIALLITLVVLEVVLLSGPAFAISVKQRTREFALMSAIGASPAQLRRIVLAGGALFGAIAAVLGVGLGILAAYLTLPLLELAVGHRTAGFDVWPSLQLFVVAAAVVTGILAALAAAVAASRVNVVAELAGRRPRPRVRRRWLFIGLAVIVVGAATGVGGVLTSTTIPMVIGIASLQLGLVACTPSLVAGVSKLGGRLGLAPRMALRETGRNRSAAAPAVAAIMAVVAGGIAITMFAMASYGRSMDSGPVSAGAIELVLEIPYDWESDEPLIDEDAFAAEIDAALAIASRVLDDPTARQLTTFDMCAPEPGAEPAYCDLRVERPSDRRCPYDDYPASAAEQRAAVEHPHCTADPRWSEYSYPAPVTDDPAVVALHTGLEGAALESAVAVLRGGGVLVADALAVRDDGTVVLERTTETETATSRQRFTFPAAAPDAPRLVGSEVVLSPAAYEELGGLDEERSVMYLLITEQQPSQRQAEALNRALDDAGFNDEEDDTSAWVYVDSQDPFMLYVSLITAVITGAVALGATAVATGLVITETRRDLTTLGAIGAAPGLRRRLSMWQAAAISLMGAGLGTAVGLASYAAVAAAVNQNLKWTYPMEDPLGFEVPWVNLAIALLAVPAIAMAGAAVATRSELPAERRLT